MLLCRGVTKSIAFSKNKNGKMSEATSSVRSSMANELNDLLTLLSEEDEQSDFSEDSNLLADMEQELNLSSEESSRHRGVHRRRGGRD